MAAGGAICVMPGEVGMAGCAMEEVAGICGVAIGTIKSRVNKVYQVYERTL